MLPCGATCTCPTSGRMEPDTCGVRRLLCSLGSLGLSLIFLGCNNHSFTCYCLRRPLMLTTAREVRSAQLVPVHLTTAPILAAQAGDIRINYIRPSGHIILLAVCTYDPLRHPQNANTIKKDKHSQMNIECANAECTRVRHTSPTRRKHENGTRTCGHED